VQCLKGEPLSGVLLRFSHSRIAPVGIFQHVERHRSDFANRPSCATSFRKCSPLDRAVASDAWNSAEKRIACDLARDVTAVEL
jgi:hypothetical protein